MNYNFLSILGTLALIGLTTRPSFATSTTVTSTGDSGAGSLRAALIDSTDADTIFFDPGVDTITLSRQIDIDRDVVIRGNGAHSTFIDGNNVTRHFFIKGNGVPLKVEMHHMTFSDGSSSGRGGSIFMNPAHELILKNITLNNNKVANSQRGGAIYFEGTLRLEDCVLTNNYSPFTAGAISSIVPAAGISSTAKLFIDHSIISGNHSPQGGGGIVAFCDTVSIVNSVITGNEANSGAGLYLGSRPETDSTYAFIANCTIAGNHCVQYETASVTAPGRGAGIFIWNNTNLHMINTIVGNNTLDNNGNFGTDIYFEGTGTFHDLGGNLISDTTNINATDPINSLVDIDPKFVQVVEPASVPTTLGDYRLRCSSPAIDMGKDTLGLTMGVDVAGLPRLVNGTIDIGAHERPILPPNLIVTNTNDAGPGSIRFLAALSCSGDTITFDPSTDGDTILLTSGEIQLKTNLTLIGNDTTNTIIDGNNSSSIFHIPNDDTIKIEGVTIQNGKAIFGGGIKKDQGYLSCFAVNISNNIVSDFGGGIRNTQGDLLIENSSIKGNTAQFGGGVSIDHGNVSLDNISIDYNTASISGGGVYIRGGEVLIDNSSINYNTANNRGGGIFVGVRRRSVGIIDVGDITLNNCSIDFNTASNESGGGIFNAGNVEMRKTKVVNNVANNGGGIYNERNLESYNSIITDNQASKEGTAGIFIHDPSEAGYNTILINTTVAGNSTGSSGVGGILIDQDGLLTITNSIVTNNSGEDISNNSGMISDGGYNIIGGNDIDPSQINSTTLLGIDPNFIRVASPGDKGSSDLRLGCGSPAINAGTPDTTGLGVGPLDIDGLPRTANDTIDIGAYERQDLIINTTVMNTQDDGPESLRHIVAFSCPGDTIRFDLITDNQAISLTSGQIEINTNMVILGNGPSNTIIDGNDNSRIFSINDGAEMGITGITIQNGKVGQSGGCILNAGELIIDQTNIDGCLSEDGGSIANSGIITGTLVQITDCVGEESAGGIHNSGKLVFNQCTIDNCITFGSGGGIYNFDGEVQLENSSISNNSADSKGGGIYNHGDIEIRKTKVVYNDAKDDGGGVHGSLTSYNSIIANNEALDGSGIFNLDTTKLFNTTIAGNVTIRKRITGGIYSTDNAILEMTNSIVSDNFNIVSDSFTLDIFSEEKIMTDNGYNIIGANNIDSNNFAPTTLLGIDPNFMHVAKPGDAEPSDLRLWCTSSAIDAGTMTQDTVGLHIGDTDLLGNPRFANGRIDIGTHEYFSGQLPTELILNNSATVKAFEVGKSIRAQVILGALNHTFRAEESVVMDPIFSIENTATLEVLVDTCDED